MSKPIFEIEGKPRGKFWKRKRSYVALYADRIMIELDGTQDVYTRDNIVDVYIKEPVVDGVTSRETVVEFYEEGDTNYYELEDETFPGLAEKMERALEREWAFVAEKRAYPETIQWFNACCAVVNIAGEQNPLIFGGAYKEPDYIAGRREALYESWSINNRRELLAMLPKLLDGRAATMYAAQARLMNGHGFDDVLGRFAGRFTEDDRDDLIEAMHSAADGQQDAALFAAIDKAGGERCVWAWDLQRAIHLSAIGYVADFLSREEAMDWCCQAGLKLQGLYRNWDEFMRCYLLGYSLWSGDSLDDEGSDAFERRKIFEHYRALRNHPWTVPWTTLLRKEGLT